MRLENAFEVDAPVADVWDLLLDVPRVVPCMPGAELVEVVGDNSWKAMMRVRLGPMAMAFDTDVERLQVDVAGHSVQLTARAKEAKGRGQARATISSALIGVSGGGTRVEVITEVSLSGRIAQFGRGAVEDVSAELVDRFTANLGEAVRTDRVDQSSNLDAVAFASGDLHVLALLTAALRRRLQRIRERLAGGRTAGER
jgi:carbon monoxide dehydrogenase subunit G